MPEQEPYQPSPEEIKQESHLTDGGKQASQEREIALESEKTAEEKLNQLLEAREFAIRFVNIEEYRENLQKRHLSSLAGRWICAILARLLRNF